MVESPELGGRKLAFEAIGDILHEPEKLLIHPQQLNSSINNSTYNRLIEQHEPNLVERQNSLARAESPSISESHVSNNTTSALANVITQPLDRSVPEFSRANLSSHSGATNAENKSPGFNLRALSDSISALENNPWVPTHELTQDLNATVLSNELVNETLNYFVNCRQRSSQMTKTYDDNDAYILLLQEKEVDLELAARIGQDLLKQNNQLKDSVKSLKEELAKRQDDVQQLKHELASKISLLDTFIEEEEHQTNSRRHQPDDDDDSRYQQQQHIDQDYSDKKGSTSTVIHYATTTQNINQNGDSEDDFNRGFSSLNYHTSNNVKNTASGEPFSSLPYHLDGNYLNNETLSRDNSHYEIDSDPNLSGLLNKSSTSCERQKLIENATFQLVECNKRLCELQDELLYKSEQSITQQEKIYNLQEQLRDSERRLDCMSVENETLRRSVIQSEESQKEMVEELRNCKHNLNELLSVFLELQKETKQHRRNSLQYTNHSGGIFFNDQEAVIEELQNISFDSFNTTNLSSLETQTGTPLEATSGVSRSSSQTQFRSSFSNTGRIIRRGHSNASSITSSVYNRGLNALTRSLSSKSGASSTAGGGALIMSMSLHEELQESMMRSERLRQFSSEDDDFDEEEDDEPDATYGAGSGRKNRAPSSNKHRWEAHLGAIIGSDDECGRDSGLHTTNRSSSVTPSNGCGSSGMRASIVGEDTDSDVSRRRRRRPDSGRRRSKSNGAANGHSSDSGTWSSERRTTTHLDTDECAKIDAVRVDDDDDSCELDANTRADKNWTTGLSSFMLCTILLMCLSFTFNGATNSNLTTRLQPKLDR